MTPAPAASPRNVMQSTVLPIAAYCGSSILMTLTNKLVLSRYSFHLAFLLCALQSAACVALIELFRALGLVQHRALNAHDARRWFPVSLALVAMIYSGSKALQYMSIPFFTIFKNLTIVMVAYSEFFLINGPRVTPLILSAFVLMVLSSVIAAWPDLTGSRPAAASAADAPLVLKYGWMMVNCFCSAFYVLAMKFKMDQVRFRDFDTVFFNNLLSIPVLLVCSLATETGLWRELRLQYGRADPVSAAEQLIVDASSRSPDEWGPMWTAIAFTSVMSFAISYCTSWCVRMTSSTTYSMAGALNKLPIAVFGMIAFSDPVTSNAVVGVLLAFGAGLVYSYAKTLKPAPYSRVNEQPITTSPQSRESLSAGGDDVTPAAFRSSYDSDRASLPLHVHRSGGNPGKHAP